MDRSKFIAIITGAISVILAVAYLLLVTLLDFRGEMLPAPQSQLPVSMPVQQLAAANPINPGVCTINKLLVSSRPLLNEVKTQHNWMLGFYCVQPNLRIL